MRKKTFNYGHFCENCRKELELDDQVFFVEDATGDYFCSEECIQEYYGPVSAHYFQQNLSMRDPHDIPSTEFEKYEKYTSLCLEKPKEVWADDGEGGERYYFYISEFSDVGGTFHYIVMCYCLENEPTFVLLAFPTRDKALANAYRKGKKIDLRFEAVESKPPVEQASAGGIQGASLDERGIALKEEMLKNRIKSDIKPDEFEEHSFLLEETIENPDEAWEMDSGDERDSLLMLITQHDEKLHYIVICARDQNKENQATWRVLYHFPTGDPGLVQRYRRGNQREGIGNYSIVH
jgi:hypothetical protein